MASFLFEETSIPGLFLIQPLYVPDRRGHFLKAFETRAFASNNIGFNLAEELESQSEFGTLRGLHFQLHHCQDKLVRVINGDIYDVAVDLRAGSATFGRWQSFRLTAENKKMLYLPKGLAHGFLTLSPKATVHYLCGDIYDPESESGIIWDDSVLKIDWPLDIVGQPTLSDRDRQLATFDEFVKTTGGLPCT